MKPQFNKQRPLSWSQISSFEFDPEQWYKKYILGEKQEETGPLLFGKLIGERLAGDPAFLPEVPRYKHMEKKFTGRIGDIELIGYLDSFCPDKKSILEYKTSSNAKRWNQAKAEEHGQLLFYHLLVWLNYGVLPETCHLCYLPCRETGSFEIELTGEPVQIFEVKKTAVDVLKFGNYIKTIRKQMIQYCIDKK